MAEEWSLLALSVRQGRLRGAWSPAQTKTKVDRPPLPPPRLLGRRPRARAGGGLGRPWCRRGLTQVPSQRGKGNCAPQGEGVRLGEGASRPPTTLGSPNLHTASLLYQLPFVVLSLFFYKTSDHIDQIDIGRRQSDDWAGCSKYLVCLEIDRWER